MSYWLKRRLKKKIFFSRRFLIFVFVGGEQFSPNLKPYINMPLCTNACCQKSEGVLAGLFELFSRKSVKFAFYRNRCAESITPAVWPPPSPGHERADG
jgi:hypothetical protein